MFVKAHPIRQSNAAHFENPQFFFPASIFRGDNEEGKILSGRSPKQRVALVQTSAQFQFGLVLWRCPVRYCHDK